jgi:aldose 1-epimerase
MNEPRPIVLETPGRLRLVLLDLGARMHELTLMTPSGLQPLLLSYADPNACIDDPYYVGASVGRYANRIAQARYRHAGGEFQLPRNDGQHCLHGGPRGFDQRFWQVRERSAQHVQFELRLADGEDGFPGNLRVSADFSLGENTVDVVYRAQTDRPCPINITAHPYFSLGSGARPEHHQFQIHADRVIAIDGEGLPVGAPIPVADSAFDFRESRRIAAKDLAADPQLSQAGGYDHCYVTLGNPGAMNLLATAYNPATGIGLTVSSNMPGMQFYTGHYLRAPFAANAGFCLEPQYWPDSPNQPLFPNTLLLPGQQYRHALRYGVFLRDARHRRSSPASA